jgi:hypothetical protein
MAATAPRQPAVRAKEVPLPTLGRMTSRSAYFCGFWGCAIATGCHRLQPRAQPTFSMGSPAWRQATKPPATSAAPFRSVAFDRTACWHR